LVQVIDESESKEKYHTLHSYILCGTTVPRETKQLCWFRRFIHMNVKRKYSKFQYLPSGLINITGAICQNLQSF